MNRVWSRRIIGFVLALTIFGIDQWFKNYVTHVLHLRERGVIEILPFFDLRWTQNFGVSMGMFTADTMEMRWILVGLTGLIAFGVTIWMVREKALGDIIALALILGGALGNIKDRYDLGYVVDYADLHFGSFRPFLIFNIADAAITIGVVLLLVRSFFMRDKKAVNPQEQAESAAEI
ncbi:MAG: signal peptidase II [Sphingomonadaceae bacterium]